MTENRRIALNIIATYGRSLYGLICGLFTGRWVLMALGETDYGLYGVVGGLTIFISFIVSLLGGAVGRFYAFSVGQAKVQADGLETCRKWFNTALFIHTALPLLVMLIGYPICEYGIRHAWLNIPPDRVEACVWVFRFVCISTFVGMFSVPFNAMYAAKQYIAELTIYSFITTTVNVCFLYYMVSHPGIWLAKYALWTCVLSLLPQLIIALRAIHLFPECRFNLHYLWSWSRVKELLHFAGWQFFGVLGSMFRGQGIAILVNKYFDLKVNAAVTVGNSLSHQCETLSGSMIAAFSPAITNACGAGDYSKMRVMAYRCCKFGTLLTLVFALPLALEIDEVLRIWLKNPPRYAAGFALCVLTTVIINKTAIGHMIAVNAKGKIAFYQAVLGTFLILTLPIAWIFTVLGLGPYASGYALILTMMFCAWGRVWFARKLVGMSAWYWLKKVFLPLVALMLMSGALGYSLRFFWEPSFLRVCLTTLLTEITMLPLAWFLILNQDERIFVCEKLKRFF